MKVTPRARSRDDRAGDPLDGLVAQDYSDVEYVAAALTTPPVSAPVPHSHLAVAP